MRTAQPAVAVMTVVTTGIVVEVSRDQVIVTPVPNDLARVIVIVSA